MCFEDNSSSLWLSDFYVSPALHLTELWFFVDWKNQIHHGGDEKMKCKLCDRKIDGGLGIYCCRCEKIVGNVNADIAAELES